VFDLKKIKIHRSGKNVPRPKDIKLKHVISTGHSYIFISMHIAAKG
jgi:hypothetical protein